MEDTPSRKYTNDDYSLVTIGHNCFIALRSLSHASNTLANTLANLQHLLAFTFNYYSFNGFPIFSHLSHLVPSFPSFPSFPISTNCLDHLPIGFNNVHLFIVFFLFDHQVHDVFYICYPHTYHLNFIHDLHFFSVLNALNTISLSAYGQTSTKHIE